MKYSTAFTRYPKVNHHPLQQTKTLNRNYTETMHQTKL